MIVVKAIVLIFHIRNAELYKQIPVTSQKAFSEVTLKTEPPSLHYAILVYFYACEACL